MSLSSKRLFQGDLVIWAIYFWLCMISLIEVYSAGSSLSYKSGDFMAPLFKQAIFLGIGTAVVWVIHSIPCRFFKLGVVLYPISIFLLILTLIIGAKENDGARWLNFGIKFQPSEIAKGALVLFVALILSFGQTEKGADKRAMKIILFATCLTCALIVTENLSTAALLFATVFVMMFIGRVPTKQLGKIVGVCLLGVVLLATIVTILLVPKSIVGTVIFMNSHTPCFPVWPFCRTAEAGKIAVLTPLYLGFCQPVSRRLFPARQAQSPIQYTIFHYKPFFSGMQVLSGVLNVFRRHFYPIFMFCGADDDCITPSAAHKPDSPRPSASVCRPFCPLPKAPCGR